MAWIALPGALLTIGAFVLLLLNSINTPIIKSLYFLQVYVSSASLSAVTGDINLGTFGYCTSGFVGITLSSLSNVVTSSGCTSTKLGYQLPTALFSTIESIANVDLSGLESSLIKSVSYLLVLQPIAAGFAALSALFALFAWLGSSRGFEIAAFVSTIFSALLAWLAWISIIVLFSIARSRIRSASDDVLDARFGKCIWMGLAAAIVLSVALCFLCVGMFGSYNEKRRTRRAETVRQRDMAYAETQANGGVPVTGYAPARRGVFSSWRRQPKGTATY